jgi:mitochondrial fission protein ELM1
VQRHKERETVLNSTTEVVNLLPGQIHLEKVRVMASDSSERARTQTVNIIALNERVTQKHESNFLPVWLIDEGQAGHRVQSEGVIQALESAGFSLATERINCQFRLRGLLRPPARAVFSRLDAARAMRFARTVSPFSQPSGPLPDIIVSSGGRTAFASRALALQANSPNVFIGNPAPFPRSWFDVVMSPIPIAAGDAIPTGVLPNLATPEQCAKQARAYWNGAPPQNVWTLLVGGARRRDHHYDAQDWRNIAAGVNALALRYGIRWLITTSRRTGEDAEAILQANLLPEAIEDIVLHGRKPKPVTQSFLGAGQRIFVTRDSLTMVSEAVMSGKPVAALLPRRAGRPSKSDTVFFSNLASFYDYKEIICDEFAEFSLGGSGVTTTNDKASKELQEAVRRLVRELRLKGYPLDATTG